MRLVRRYGGHGKRRAADRRRSILTGVLRRVSTRRLLVLCAVTATIVVGAAAGALAALSDTASPPRRPLAVAVHRALAAPPVRGITARIAFTDGLLPNVGRAQDGPRSVLQGATGRLWLGDAGRFRLELQSRDGDSQVLSDGRLLRIYDASSHTVYRAALPAAKRRDERGHRRERVPTLGRIRAALRRLGMRATLSPAQPGVTAGRPSYAERLAPRRDGGLLSGVRVAWDAARGAPLDLALFARGHADPVVELRATDISYGPVAPSVFAFRPPPGTKVTPFTLPSRADHGRHRHGERTVSMAAARRALGFAPAAPARLADRPRHGMHLVAGRRDAGALVLYGRGLDGVAVFERRATAGSGAATLPTKVSIDGRPGHELTTPLGTVVRFDRGGVRYTVVASQPRATVEAAARGL